MPSLYPQFFYTVSLKELRPSMPTIPVLLSAASFVRQRKDGSYRLIPPRLPDTIVTRGADCGGFTAATRWNGVYRFTPVQYIQWLSTWRPQWAAVMDLPCLGAETGGDPGAAVVCERQRYATEMAHLFWHRYRLVAWPWCPTITGWHPSDYERHARELAPLIRAMHLYYSDPGWADEEDEESKGAFRVGIGSLYGRAKPAFLLEVIQRVSAVLGPDIPLHLWGVKLRTLQAGLVLPGVVSLDSGAWNNLFGLEHERRRASGLSEVEYSWQVSQPTYKRKITTALAMPQQQGLNFTPPAYRERGDMFWYRITPSLAEQDGIADELLERLTSDPPRSIAEVFQQEPFFDLL